MREAMFSARPMKSNPRVAKPRVVTFETGRVSSPRAASTRNLQLRRLSEAVPNSWPLCSILPREHPVPNSLSRYFTPRSRRLLSLSAAAISFQFPFPPNLCQSYDTHSCSGMPVRFPRRRWGRWAREIPLQLGTRSLRDQRSRTCK